MSGMSNVKLVLNREAVSELLLKSPEMQSIIGELGQEIAARAGEGYVSEVKVGQNRAYCNIRTDTLEARIDNARNNTLLKSRS